MGRPVADGRHDGERGGGLLTLMLILMLVMLMLWSVRGVVHEGDQGVCALFSWFIITS